MKSELDRRFCEEFSRKVTPESCREEASWRNGSLCVKAQLTTPEKDQRGLDSNLPNSFHWWMCWIHKVQVVGLSPTAVMVTLVIAIEDSARSD
jgi:hypothetical protein